MRHKFTGQAAIGPDRHDNTGTATTWYLPSHDGATPSAGYTRRHPRPPKKNGEKRRPLTLRSDQNTSRNTNIKRQRRRGSPAKKQPPGQTPSHVPMTKGEPTKSKPSFSPTGREHHAPPTNCTPNELYRQLIVPPRLYPPRGGQAAFTASNITHTPFSRCACPPLLPAGVQTKKESPSQPTQNPMRWLIGR